MLCCILGKCKFLFFIKPFPKYAAVKIKQLVKYLDTVYFLIWVIHRRGLRTKWNRPSNATYNRGTMAARGRIRSIKKRFNSENGTICSCSIVGIRRPLEDGLLLLAPLVLLADLQKGVGVTMENTEKHWKTHFICLEKSSQPDVPAPPRSGWSRSWCWMSCGSPRESYLKRGNEGKLAETICQNFNTYA